MEQTAKTVQMTEELANQIEAIAAGINKLRDGRLKEEALVLLIQHAAPRKRGTSTVISKNEARAALANATR